MDPASHPTHHNQVPRKRRDKKKQKLLFLFFLLQTTLSAPTFLFDALVFFFFLSRLAYDTSSIFFLGPLTDWTTACAGLLLSLLLIRCVCMYVRMLRVAPDSHTGTTIAP